MSFFENTRKPQGFGGKLMTKMMNSGHSRLSQWGFSNISVNPDAEVLVHPECNADIIKQADYVGSTSGIINYAAGSKNKKFIIGTVKGVIYELLDRRPDAEFYFPRQSLYV